MHRPSSTHLLIGAFFAAMLALWGLERAGVLTEAEQARRSDRVLPDLIDLPPSEILRLEIVKADERLVFERRGERRWVLSGPSLVEAEADPNSLERLVATILSLRKSPEAGMIDGPPSDYGLAPPAAVVQLWKNPEDAPIATLEVGRKAQQERFVRAERGGPIEVVPARSLAAVDRPGVEWRETALIPPWAFPISGVRIRKGEVDLALDRDDRGGWMLSAPVEYPADGRQVDRLIEVLGALRVDPTSGGFLESVEASTDYGLEPPSASVELHPIAPGSQSITLEIGAALKDRRDDVYVRLAGRKDVMIVDGRFLRELPATQNDLRSRLVASIFPPAVDRIEIDGPSGSFRLDRGRAGWNLTAPVAVRADDAQVEAFLKSVEELQTSDFFAPGFIGEPEVDQPLRRVRIWQSSERAPKAGDEDRPAFSLAVGRHDVLRKVVFARREGDVAILALPDVFLSAFPTNAFAFRSLALPSVSPTSISRLTILRPGRTTVLEPAGGSGAPEGWKMLEPVAAEADLGAVTSAVIRLSELRASSFVADAKENPSRFGLDAPILEVRWEIKTPNGQSDRRSLRIGQPDPTSPSRHYGVLTDFPAVFTIEAEDLIPFGGEFHETRVMRFRAAEVQRLTLRTETRELSYRRRPGPLSGPTSWRAEPGTVAEGVDLSRFDNLVQALSELRTIRFLQYQGPFPPGAGLSHPRLTITVETAGRSEPIRLRIGSRFLDAWTCAAAGDASSGSVFLLQGPAWEGLIRGVEGGLPPIPDDPFAPPGSSQAES